MQFRSAKNSTRFVETSGLAGFLVQVRYDKNSVEILRSGAGSSSGKTQHQHRNVVRTAPLQRHLYERRARLGRTVGLHDVGQFLITDHAPEAVGTEQEGIAVFQRDRMFRKIGDYFPSRPEGGGKDVPLGMGLGIFGAHDTAFDQPANVRVIAGKTSNGRAANEVEATIAHMREAELATYYGQGGTGSSHSVELRMLNRITLDAFVSCRKALDQRGLRIVMKSALVDVAYRFDRQLAGFLSAFVSAHAVGYDRKTALTVEFLVGIGLPVKIGILVVGTLAADVGETRQLYSRLCILTVNRHI